MQSNINTIGVPLKQWALFRSTSSTKANAIVPLVLRGQDSTGIFSVASGVVSLAANKSYIVSAGMAQDATTAIKELTVQTSTDGGSTWSYAFGSQSLSAMPHGGSTSGGTSVCDILSPTVSTLLRIKTATNGSSAGVWLRLEVV